MVTLTDCNTNIAPLKCYQTEDNHFIGGSTTNADRRLYYLEHKEKFVEYQRRYRTKHNKTIKQRQKRWYQQNKEKLRIKYGYKTRYKPKKLYLSNQISIIKKPIIVSFN